MVEEADEEEQEQETESKPKKRKRKRARKSCPSFRMPVVLANGEVDLQRLGGGGGGGGEETLSDLDDEIDEYILNDEEVCILCSIITLFYSLYTVIYTHNRPCVPVCACSML